MPKAMPVEEEFFSNALKRFISKGFDLLICLIRSF
jgi:hypothetical protein